MKTFISSVYFSTLLCIACASAQADDVIAQIDLTKDTVGQAPSTAPTQGAILEHFTAVTSKGTNTLTVADKLGDLAGPVLKFEKKEDVNGAPAAVVGTGQIEDGKVHITWRAVIADYQKGTRSQPIEPLLTVNLLGKDGLPMVSVQAAHIEDARGGAFNITGHPISAGNWTFGVSNRFELIADLDQKTCTLKIDDKPAAENVKLQADGPLRFIQFRDGTGVGGVDGIVHRRDQ